MRFDKYPRILKDDLGVIIKRGHVIAIDQLNSALLTRGYSFKNNLGVRDRKRVVFGAVKELNWQGNIR